MPRALSRVVPVHLLLVFPTNRSESSLYRSSYQSSCSFSVLFLKAKCLIIMRNIFTNLENDTHTKHLHAHKTRVSYLSYARWLYYVHVLTCTVQLYMAIWCSFRTLCHGSAINFTSRSTYAQLWLTLTAIHSGIQNYFALCHTYRNEVTRYIKYCL